MRKISFPTFLCSAFVLCALSSSKVCHGKDKQNVGRVRSQIGTLYDLRNKLKSGSSSSGGSSSSFMGSSKSEKEGRGYSFHYNPSDISHPIFSTNYASQDFHSRMGKIAEPSSASSSSSSSSFGTGNKKKHGDKNWDKYAKYAYKTSGLDGKEQPIVNSFNIHQNDTDQKLHSVSTTTTTSTQPSIHKVTTSSSFKSTTSSPAASSGFDISRLASIGLGLNDAMTSVLTQKFMGMIDQDFPQGILKPLKHIVSSGNRMVEFWDKRANARDGKPPGIVEMFGYGLEQLKKYRDGQSMKSSDPIANLTSPSKTLIQGMVTVKKLTNRVLGYDTDEAAVESRGGYGHDGGYGGGGYGHHVSYGGMGGLDPFALLAALAFGAFLLQLLLTLLNSSARSLDVVDINTPLLLSDYHVPSFMTKMDKIFGTPTTRTRRATDEEENTMFTSIIDKLDGMYKTYKTVSTKPSCARLYLCRLAVQDADADENTLTSKFYMYGLTHLAGDNETNDFVRSIQTRVAKGEDVDCQKEVTACTPLDQEN